jgi:hypothetical protein
MLHIGMSHLLTMPYKRGVCLPPKKMGPRGHAFWPHVEQLLSGIVATSWQVAAFDFAIRTALLPSHSISTIVFLTSALLASISTTLYIIREFSSSK